MTPFRTVAVPSLQALTQVEQRVTGLEGDLAALGLRDVVGAGAGPGANGGLATAVPRLTPGEL